MPDQPELLPCPFCGQQTDWIDNHYGGLSPACTNQDCFAYAIPMYFCTEDAMHTRAEPRWIPVTERLPEENRLVQVYNGSVTCGILREPQIIGGGWMIAFDYSGVLEFQFPVTHWMPLPLPPKEVEG